MSFPAKVICGLCVFVLAVNAHASQFQVTWTGGPGFGGLAIVTGAPLGGGAYLMTALTGTQGAMPPLSLLAPSAYGGNDNVFYPTGTPQLTVNGFSFTDGGTTDFNIFWGGIGAPGYYECDSQVDEVCLGVERPDAVLLTSFSITPVPEPGTIGLLVAGSSAIVGVIRRRKYLKQDC